MNFAREIELVHTIDDELRRLQLHLDELASAGDERPLLTLVSHDLRRHVDTAAALAGRLAGLLPDASERAPSPGGAAVTSDRADEDAHGEGAAAPQEASPPIVRRGRRPRVPGDHRRAPRRGRLTSVEAGPAGDAMNAAPEPAPPPKPVYLLRKAGARDAEVAHTLAPRVDEHDQLRRLQQFFQTADDSSPAAPSRN